MSKLKELKEKRAKAHADAVALLGAAEQTPETRSKADAFLAEVETYSQDITRIERADRMAAELAGTVPVTDPNADPAASTDPAAAEKAAKNYRSQYMNWLAKGKQGGRMTVRGGVDVAFLETIKRSIELAPNVEARDQQAGQQSITYTEGAPGGYFVPAGFVYDVEKATKFYCNLLDGNTVRIMETATGNVLPYPTNNDTNEAWTIVGEGQQVSDQGQTPNYPNQGVAPSGQPGDLGLGSITLNAYKGTTGLIRVSLELLQDSAFNLESFLTDAFAVRLGRGYEYYLTQGNGSNQPSGILPQIAASGATPQIAAGSSTNDGSSNTGANSIGYQDIINLIHSVDPTYRNGAKFMFHDQTLRFLRTLLDKFGRPYWQPSVKDEEPDTFAGYEYVINQSFPQIAASAVTVAFGQWSKFLVRKVRDLQVLRLDERFADFGQVAYIAFSRIDSKLIDAGTHPLNVLQQHS